MEIRQLQESDTEAYRRLRLEALCDSPESFGSSYEEEREYPLQLFKDRIKNSCTLGAVLDAELVGMVTLMQETRHKTSHKANIYAMYVTPSQRGQGLGKKLMLEAIKQAQTIKEIEQIHLTVVSNNEAARQLYLSLGFVIYGKEKHALKIGNVYFDEEHLYTFL